MTAFDLRHSLPHAPTVIEASAGTGKTYAIAGLVARYVAAGTPLDQMLVVTFTRAATAELRDRVRQRLVDTRSALRTLDDGPQQRLTADDDPVIEAILRNGLAPSLAVARLTTAIADVDGAAITTIHQFCSTALEGIGLSAGLDRRATLVDLDRELRDEVVHDLLVRRAVQQAGGEHVGLWHAERLVQVALAHREAVIEPPPAHDEPAKVTAYRWLVESARAEIADRKHRARWLGYDDLLSSLRDALRDAEQGDAIARALARRYQVVLVDEFQDTDPVQWEILRRAFGHGALVLVADPKQAIYAFRGADVRAYVAARAHVGQAAVRSLGVSWRADQRLLDALNVLLGGATLGQDIAYRQVRAAPGRPAQGILGTQPDAALRLRVLRQDAPGLGDDGGTMGQRSGVVAADVASQVSHLLAQDVRIVDGSSTRVLEPRDVAVLVRTNAEAAAIQERLHAVAVPAVINGAGSVLATVAATDWLHLLRALERPHDEGRARAAALTPLIDWDADQLQSAADPHWEGLHDQLHDWAAHLRHTSPASLWRRLRAEARVAARLLAHPGGERRLTDLDHVADLAHVAWATGVTTPHDLVAWLEAAIARVDEGMAADEQARRLESDADAVQVLTVHRCKGLEFSVVYCASLWRSTQWYSVAPAVHEEGRQIIDVGGPAVSERRKAAERFEAEEELRLMYVALTRARHQVVAWWARYGDGGRTSGSAPLSKVLFCRSKGRANTRCASGFPPRDDDAMLERIHEALAPAGAAVSVEQIRDVAPPVVYQPRERVAPKLQIASFSRSIDHSWRRTSYSALTAWAHAGTTETDLTTTTDEELDEPTAGQRDGAEAPSRDVALPLGGLPGGTHVGTYVHALLELCDFAAEDLDAQLRMAASQLQGRSPLDADDHEILLAGLAEAIATPWWGDLALRGLTRAQRRDEMVFELPLGGGLQASGHVRLEDLRRVLARHAHGDPVMAAYAPMLRTPGFADGVRGFLTGSIDLVARVDGRYAVVDYKTNRLTPWGSEPSLWDYRPAAVLDAMCRGHYPLQALLYLVALHRFLRWRLASRYDPEQALAGSAYLFVRGMIGAHTPRIDGGTPGVHRWRPSVELVDEVSDLLHRGASS